MLASASLVLASSVKVNQLVANTLKWRAKSRTKFGGLISCHTASKNFGGLILCHTPAKK